MARQRKNILKSGLVEDEGVKPVRQTKKTTKATKILVPYKARGKYRIVDVDSYTIEPSSAEYRTEDQILDPSRRARLLDLCRNLVRNSSLFNTLLGQISTNVVGTVGGKVSLSLPSEGTNGVLKKAFRKWTRNADFYTSDTLNHFLKRVLREFIIGGDCVVLFDDGLVEDSGKLMFFESNELVSVNQDEIEKRYGKGAWCSQGKVYSAHGRWIGTVVSKSQTNGSIPTGGEADPSKCYFLKRDPDQSPLDGYWYQMSTNWREGRGISQAASAIGTLHQLEDLVASELLASRRNAQLFCWLTQTPESQEATPMPFQIDGDVDVDSMTEEDIKELVKQDKEDVKTISFNKAKEASILYEQLPDGFSAQQLQMTHPNMNVEALVNFLANRCAASLGLSRVFATGDPQDSSWRANQLFTWPAIKEMQKSLEQLLDFVFAKWLKWSQKKGIVKAYVVDDFEEYVDWIWSGLDDLDEVKHQQGIRLGLENNVLTYREVLGSNWKEQMEQVAYEHKWLADRGITHPSELMISGGQTEASKSNTTSETEETTTVKEETLVEEK